MLIPVDGRLSTQSGSSILRGAVIGRHRREPTDIRHLIATKILARC